MPLSPKKFVQPQGMKTMPPPPPPQLAPPQSDEMTIKKCRPTKIQWSLGSGTLLCETQNEAQDVGHCSNPQNNLVNLEGWTLYLCAKYQIYLGPTMTLSACPCWTMPLSCLVSDGVREAMLPSHQCCSPL